MCNRKQKTNTHPQYMHTESATEKIKWCKFMTLIFMKFLLSIEYKECAWMRWRTKYVCMCASIFFYFIFSINKWNEIIGNTPNRIQFESKKKYCSIFVYFLLFVLRLLGPANISIWGDWARYTSLARMLLIHWIIKDFQPLDIIGRFSFMMQKKGTLVASDISRSTLCDWEMKNAAFKADYSKFHVRNGCGVWIELEMGGKRQSSLKWG